MYVVAGASGNTGSAVARTLLARGVPVRVALRDAGKSAPWTARGCEAAHADLRDPRALSRAFEGAAAAFVLNPPAYTSDDLFAAAEEIADAVRAAAETSGLPRLVVLSSIGAHLASGHGIIRTNSVFEGRLAGLGARVLFVRPAYFMQNWGAVAQAAARDGVLPSFLAPLDRAIPMVSTEDVGRVAAMAMLGGPHPPRVIELRGPREYAPRDAAAAFAEALGHPVAAVAVPEAGWPDVLARIGFTPRTIAAWLELFRGFNSGLIAFERADAAHEGRVTLEEAVSSIAGDGKPPSLGVHA